MRGTDRTIVYVLAAVVLAGAFYFMVLSPKRNKAAELNDQISSLKDSIAQQEQVAQFAEQAREDFPTYYGRLVVLGKAVPERADTASMLVQLNSIAGKSAVDFRGITLSQGASGEGTSASAPAPAPTPPAAGAAPAEGAAPADSGTPPAAGGETTAPAGGSTETTPSAATPAATSAPAAATEATAATLPIGAVVGPAGLPTLPYELTFRGGFFNIADFIGGVDGLVQMREKSGHVAANGRLMTVDGFALEGGEPGSSPTLKASFLVTSYVTPSEQGLTAGATPGGPAPAQPEATPASGPAVVP